MWSVSGRWRRFQTTMTSESPAPNTMANAVSAPTSPKDPKITSASVTSSAGVWAIVTTNDSGGGVCTEDLPRFYRLRYCHAAVWAFVGVSVLSDVRYFRTASASACAMRWR